MAMVAPKLKYSGDDLAGWVDSTPSFDDEDRIFRMDLLHDWISGLENLYNKAYVERCGTYKIPEEHIESLINTMVDNFVSNMQNDPEKMLNWIKNRARSDFESMKPDNLVRTASYFDINLNDFKITNDKK